MSESRKRRRSDERDGKRPVKKTLFLGGLAPTTTAHEVFDALVGHGAVESLRFNKARTAAFIDMLRMEDAEALEERGSLSLKRKAYKLEWANLASHSDSAIQMAIKMGATRCIFLSNMTVDSDTCAQIAEHCARFGEVDQVRANRERGHIFAHMSSVGEATEATGALKRLYPAARLSFARDRCTVENESGELSDRDEDGEREEKRTIYLGGVPAECTIEDLGNVVRGGGLQSIRLAKEKGCAFLTFLEKDAAQLFMDWASRHGLYLHQRPIRLAWSTTTSLTGPLKAAIRRGATRCLLFSNLADRRGIEEDLRKDLSKFGALDSIRYHPKRQSATIHFANLLDALRVHDTLTTTDSHYAHIQISFGRDRCAEIPRGMLAGEEPTPQEPSYPYGYYPFLPFMETPYPSYPPPPFMYPPVKPTQSAPYYPPPLPPPRSHPAMHNTLPPPPPPLHNPYYYMMPHAPYDPLNPQVNRK